MHCGCAYLRSVEEVGGGKMKVTMQHYKRSTDIADKILEVEGVQLSTPNLVKDFLSRTLTAARVLWPDELRGVYIGTTPQKRKKP
jgi:hypothetical protein